MEAQGGKKTIGGGWLLWVLGGIAATATAGLVVQWKYASLGRQISRNVTGFLTDHGASVKDGVVSGGVVAAPLKINAAVVATVSEMLRAVGKQLDRQEQQPSKESRPAVAAAAVGGDDDDVGAETYVRQRKPDNKKAKSKSLPSSPAETLGDFSADSASSRSGGGGDSPQYNIDEFRPANSKPPSEAMLFQDD